MTQYMLAVHHENEEDAIPPGADMAQIEKDLEALNTELKANGHWVGAWGLEPPTTATVVRVGETGKVVTIDGPYLETKEQLGGFWIIEAESLDVALDIAQRGTVACRLPVEVRPMQQQQPED